MTRNKHKERKREEGRTESVGEKEKMFFIGGNIKNKTEELVVGTRVVGPINDP